MTTPLVSIVVVSFRGLDLVAESLQSLRSQCLRHGAELILARAAREPRSSLDRVAAGCCVVLAPAEADVPRLRAAGLVQAQGEWVALTEDHCIADPGWLDALMAARAGEVHVLGGRMGNAKRERMTDCGAFFSEYGFFGATPSTGTGKATPLVTGANVAYHRSVIGQVATWAGEGLWENVIHDRLRQAGRRFRLVPAARIRQNQSYRLAAFCRDRFEHGRDYAATRSRSLPVWRRAILLAATPLLPGLLAARIARLTDPDARLDFGRALPATMTFLAAWSLGEAAGYARRRRTA